MLNFFATIKGASVVAGIAAGSIMLGEVAPAITGDTHITVGGAVAACGIVGGGALWIGRWMQKVNDSLKDLKSSFHNLPCQPRSHKCEKEK